MSSVSDDRLQQYFDGELHGAERDAVQRAVESDPSLQSKLTGLERLSVLISASTDELSRGADFEALFGAIRAAERENRAPDDDAMFPVDVSPKVDVSPSREVHQVRAAATVTSLDAARERRAIRFGVIGAVVAAAAAVIFVIAPIASTPSSIDRASGAVAAVAPGSTPRAGSEVEAVDFGFNTGAIFSVESQEGTPYAVVWISDEKYPDEEERLR